VSDVRRRELRTEDGLALEAEWAPGADSASPVSVVLCHPHPQFGGSMRSIVTSVLFEQLPAAGYPSLRFNFRGVKGSEGTYAEGALEPLDVVAAITAAAELFPATRIALVGWSFGADISLTVVDERVAGWVAIAPPLRFGSREAASDARRKHLILAEHDEFRAPTEVRDEVASWPATTLAIVPGASHFFVGRTDRVVTETRAGLEAIATTTSGSP
jgi:uncharacterized protein